jgi:NitT/TauT family transport system substrate-binding protein
MNRREMLARAATLSLGAAALMQPQGALAQDLTTLLAASAPEDSVSAVLWAQKSGLFRRNGVDVRLEAQRSGSVVAAAVAGGTYQLGKASITALIAAHLRGVPFVVIAPASIYEANKPNTGLLVKVDSPLRTAADLNGKTVAVASLNDLYAIGTRLWVDKNGGDSSTLKLIEMPLNVIPGALVAGRIDAGASDTPALQDAIDSGKVRLLSHMQDAFGVNFLVTAWFTTTEFAAKNRPAVRSFVKALRESAIYVNAHHADTVDLIAKFTAVDPSVITKMPRVTVGTELDPKLIQPVINAAAKYKAIASAFDARDLLSADFS